MNATGRTALRIASACALPTFVVALGVVCFPLPATAKTIYTNFAGYVAQPGSSPTSASVTFAVPTLSCKSSSLPERIGIETNLHEDTRDSVTALVVLTCANKSATYAADWAFSERGSPPSEGSFSLTLSPGDTLTETVTARSTQSAVTVDDTTTSDVAKKKGPGGITAVYSEVGMTCAGRFVCLPFPKFGAVDFADATVGDSPFGSENPTEYQIKHISTSALATGGESFSDAYK